MTGPLKVLVIVVDETDVWGEMATPLSEAIVRRLRQLEIAGATVLQGIMGFGSHLKLHYKRLFGVPDDRPIVILAVDSENKLRSALPEIQGMVREGLILLLDGEAIPLQ